LWGLILCDLLGKTFLKSTKAVTESQWRCYDQQEFELQRFTHNGLNLLSYHHTVKSTGCMKDECLWYWSTCSKSEMCIHICIFRGGLNVCGFFLLFHSIITFHSSKRCFGTAEKFIPYFCRAAIIFDTAKIQTGEHLVTCLIFCTMASLDCLGKLCCLMYCCTMNFHFVSSSNIFVWWNSKLFYELMFSPYNKHACLYWSSGRSFFFQILLFSLQQTASFHHQKLLANIV